MALLEEQANQDSEWERHRHQRRLEFHQKTREFIGDMVTGLVPTELICPPVPWNEFEAAGYYFSGITQTRCEKARMLACCMVLVCTLIWR